MILGIRQGAPENATVVSELLSYLVSRELDFTEPRLYILDGAKALTASSEKAVQVCVSGAARIASISGRVRKPTSR